MTYILTRFYTWTEQLQKAVVSALEVEVADAIKSNISLSVAKNVYDAYPETQSPRRMHRGGLMDERNYHHEVEKNLNSAILTVSNDTPFQGTQVDYTNLPTVITTGNSHFRQPFPRPFMQEELDMGLISSALDKGLRRQGF